MSDFLRLDGLTTISVEDVGDAEILVSAEGGTRPLLCSRPGCRSSQLVANGTYVVLVRDIPHHRKLTTIKVRRGRTRCKICGQNDSFDIPAFHERRSMTKRLVKMIEDQCLTRLFANIARDVGLDESTVRDVAYEHISNLEAKREVEPPRVLGLDEFYIYDQPSAILTNIGELSVYDMLESRTTKVLKPVIENILAQKQTEIIVTDLFPPYHHMLRRLTRRVPVVADRFHVVRLANYGLDKVRRRVQAEFSAEDRRLLKAEAGVLDSNSANLTPQARECLSRWLSRSEILRAAYEAKERFAAVYDHADRKDAEAAWAEWRRTLPEIIARDFAQASRALEQFPNEVLNYFDYEYTNGYTESVNGLVKTLNRLGRGYSWRVLRARMLFHKPARDKTIKRVSKRVLRTEMEFMRPGMSGGTRSRYVNEMVPVEHGPHIPTLIRFLRMSPDYKGPVLGEPDPIDWTPTDFEIEDRERRALIELAELEEDERNG